MKKLMALCALVLGFTSAAEARVLIEPYLGYEMSTTKDPDGKMDGSLMGLRLAYRSPVMFWAGIDGAIGVSGTVRPDAGANESYKRTSVYGVVGLDFPILVRAWAGYGFMNELDMEDSGKVKGTSYKLGAAFTGLPFLSLNFEYVNETFTEVGGYELAVDAKNTTYVVSISLPLTF